VKGTYLETIPISDIETKDRNREDLGDINGLRQDIREIGLIHAVAVVEVEGGEKPFRLLVGGRRLAAVSGIKEEYKFGKTIVPPGHIPANVYDSSLEGLDLAIIELAENIRRKDLHYVEEIKAKERIHLLMVEKYGEKASTSPDAPGHSIRDTASMLGIEHPGLSQDIALSRAIDLFPELKKAKNKTEAHKILRQMKKKADTSQRAAEIEKKMAATPMEKIKAGLRDAYIVGDFFEKVKDVPADSVQLAEIDPPYSIGLQELKREYGSVYATDNYNEVKPDIYKDFMGDVLMETYRVLTKNGWVIVWFGPQWFHVIHSLMVKVGFKTRPIPAIWAKPTGQTMRPEIYLASCYEMFFYGTKESGVLARQGRRNVFDFKPVPPVRKIHPTERPIELMVEIISTFVGSDADVIVPFLGSGNTILAASNLLMYAFGYELNEPYKRPYVVRVDEGEPKRYTSYGIDSVTDPITGERS